MIKAILFDLDNTLIDFIKLKKKASSAAALAMVNAGLKLERNKAGKELFEFYLEDGIDGDTAFSNFIKKHNGKMNDRILAAGINAYLDAKIHYLNSFPGVASTLKKLKNKDLKLGVVTDAPRLKAHQRLDSMKIADLFDFVIGFEDTGKHKPSPLPFRKALAQLKLKPSEVLFVGDWPEKDIEGAKKQGMKTCWAKYGAMDKKKKVKADFEINKFGDVLKSVIQ